MAFLVGVVPEALRGLPLDQKVYALTGLVGGTLQGLFAALSAMSPAQRNAAPYPSRTRHSARFQELLPNSSYVASNASLLLP